MSCVKRTQVVKLIKEKLLPNLDEVAIQFIKASYQYQQHRQQAETQRRQREIKGELSLANSLGRYALFLLDTKKTKL